MQEKKYANESTLLDDNRVQAQFHFSSLHNALLNSVLSDEAEHAHLLLLTNSVSTILEVARQKLSTMQNLHQL